MPHPIIAVLHAIHRLCPPKVTTLDDWRRIFYANFFGCYWSCQAAPMFVYPDKVRCVHSEPHPKISLLFFGRYA
jgi:hypothetical protein